MWTPFKPRMYLEHKVFQVVQYLLYDGSWGLNELLNHYMWTPFKPRMYLEHKVFQVVQYLLYDGSWGLNELLNHYNVDTLQNKESSLSGCPWYWAITSGVLVAAHPSTCCVESLSTHQPPPPWLPLFFLSAMSCARPCDRRSGGAATAAHVHGAWKDTRGGSASRAHRQRYILMPHFLHHCFLLHRHLPCACLYLTVEQIVSLLLRM